MSAPTPYVVASWIASEIQDQAYVTLRSVIELTLRLHIGSMSEEGVADLAEELEVDVFRNLQLITDQLLRVGTESSFLLDGDPGSAYIKVQNQKAVKLLTYLKSMSPAEFEGFCAKILTRLGANARSTGKTNDGGVDFVATDIPISNENSLALKMSYPLLVGQAKRYKENNLVSVTDLRAFLGGALIKADEIKRQEERFGLYSPTIFAFWTTSDFNMPARKFAVDSGLWCLNGLSLAQLTIKLDLDIVS